MKYFEREMIKHFLIGFFSKPKSHPFLGSSSYHGLIHPRPKSHSIGEGGKNPDVCDIIVYGLDE